MKTEELVYSPDEEFYSIDEQLQMLEAGEVPAKTSTVGMPRIWFMSRGSNTGIGSPVDLHYWNAPSITRYDVAQTFQEDRKIALRDFGTAINSLLETGKTRNGLLFQSGTSIKTNRLIFYLYT